MENKETVKVPNKNRKEVIVPPDEAVGGFNIKPYVPLISSLIGLLNFLLVEIFGVEPFPYTVQETVNIVSMALVVIGTLYGWWKNNDVTKQAKKRTEVADQAVPKDK